MSECKHENRMPHYGFGRSLGFRGLGVQEICEDCCAILDWTDDYECNTPEEIEHNKEVLKKLKAA